MTNQRPRKRFGQHFLVDTSVIDAIALLINAQADDEIVEIGPGRGALTTALVESGAAVTAIEIDRDLAAHISAKFEQVENFALLVADALNVDVTTLPMREKVRVVGNLPYNISTPLILKLLKDGAGIADMTFMLQKEVVDRLAAHPGTKAYGRLSVMVQSRCRVTPEFEVATHAFDPPPKVMSKLVRITPQESTRSSRAQTELEKCVRLAFSQRRKTLRNTLGKTISHEILAGSGIDLTQRAEDISVAQYLDLAQALCEAK